MLNENLWIEQLKKELKSETIGRQSIEIEDLSWEVTDNNTLKSPIPPQKAKDNAWVFYCYHHVENSAKSNTEILQDLNQGAGGLLITFDTIPDFNTLFNGVLFEYISVRIRLINRACYDATIAWIEKTKPANVHLESPLLNMPLAKSLVSGFDVYATGGNCWQELGYVINQIEKHLSYESKSIIVEFGVGENFVIEAAKINAFHWLLSALKTKHNAPNFSVIVRARLGWRNKSINELHTNQIRQTSEALSAIIGGIHELCIPPHDLKFAKESQPLIRRMAVNIAHIIKEESHLNGCVDIAQGSYILNHLSHQLCDKVWEVYQTDNFDEFLMDQICKTCAKRINRVNNTLDNFIGIKPSGIPKPEMMHGSSDTGAFQLPNFYYVML